MAMLVIARWQIILHPSWAQLEVVYLGPAASNFSKLHLESSLTRPFKSLALNGPNPHNHPN